MTKPSLLRLPLVTLLFLLPTCPPPPPEKVTGGSDISNSNSTNSTDTATGTARPARKKSVRMSLPPTFSATPPAVYFDDSESERRRQVPWTANPSSSAQPSEAGPWSSRLDENAQRDVWQDSSDEDAEYSAARRLLARVTRKV